MKQPGVILTLIVFIAAVSWALAAQQEKVVRPLTASLSGSAEKPEAGDSDGGGVARVTFLSDENRICYEATLTNIQSPESVSIHSGTFEQVGPVVIKFGGPANEIKGCATIEHYKLLDIARTPANYYINVTNQEFPNGALRGQLGK